MNPCSTSRNTHTHTHFTEQKHQTAAVHHIRSFILNSATPAEKLRLGWTLLLVIVLVTYLLTSSSNLNKSPEGIYTGRCMHVLYVCIVRSKRPATILRTHSTEWNYLIRISRSFARSHQALSAPVLCSVLRLCMYTFGRAACKQMGTSLWGSEIWARRARE